MRVRVSVRVRVRVWVRVRVRVSRQSEAITAHVLRYPLPTLTDQATTATV